MAIALSNRRVVLAKVEAARGTAETLVASADGVPLIREASYDIRPNRVDRPTLRLSLTDYADIYPGKYTVELTIAVEVHGRDSGFPTSPPSWTRLLRACAMRIFANADNLFAYRVSALTTDNGPLRHGEALKGAAGSTALGGADGDNLAFGDGFSHDGGTLTTVFIDEGATAGDGIGTISSNRGANETVFTADQRSVAKCLGYVPESAVNISGSVGQITNTIEIFADGKKLKAKGCMGTCSFEFNHGDAVLARFTMQGVMQAPGGYADATMPTDAYEGHKLPPTFLGTRLTLAAPTNNPAASSRYGTEATTFEGGLNKLTLSNGNTVILQPNSLDADGVQHALITDREPAGSFNPTEVLSSEFDFVARFIAGTPARMHILLGATLHNDVTTADQNTFEWFVPGITFTGLGDADRDGINIWDGSFAMGGGDYDITQFGELIGQDNEFTIIHR